MSSKPINFNKIDVSKITFTKLEDNPRVNSQKIGYPRYTLEDGTEVQLKIKSPKISSEVYGIPREGAYYPDAKSRAHYKFGFCHERKAQQDINYEEIGQFMKLLTDIDEMCDTDEFRKEQFGKEADKYEYQPLVRTSQEPIDEQSYLVYDNGERKKDDNGREMYRPPYTKIKLDLEYSADPDNQSTKPTFAIAELKDGKRTNIELNTFEDAVKMLKYLNKLRFIISFNKIYAQKKAAGAGKNAKKTYGITLKATNIEVEQSAYAVATNSNEDAFADSDTEEVVTNISKITRVQKSGNLDEDVEEDNEQVDEATLEAVEDEDVEEEVLEEAPVKASGKSKTTPVAATTSKPAPKKGKTATK